MWQCPGLAAIVRWPAGSKIEAVLRIPVPAHRPLGADVQQGYRSFLLPVEGCLMADVTDPPPADGSGIDGADGRDTAGRLQVGMSTRQCAGRVVVALSGELDVTDAARIDAARIGALVMTGVPLYSSVEEAAGVASRQRAARPVAEPDASAVVAGLPTVRPERQQEEGQRDPHQQSAAADTGPHSS